MRAFIYNALPSRIVFDADAAAQVPVEIEALGCRKAMVLSTPEQVADAEKLAAKIGGLAAGVFSGAAMHTPVQVTETAMKAIQTAHADCLVALGGGSTTGLGKAIALRTDLPQIVIPTTYAGSEATPILGQTEGGRKTTLRSPKVLPEVVIYDISLTLTLPVKLSITSGMNAVAHAAEALYAKDANPVIDLLAIEGIAAITRALPGIKANPSDRGSRSDALYGAWACGTCLGAVGMALHHKLCHVVGGSFDLPHAETHTVILPHSIAFNAPDIPEAMAKLSATLHTSDPAGSLFDLARDLGAPTSLASIGMKESDLDRAADEAAATPYWNPRQITRAGMRALLDDAFHGRRPTKH